MYLSNKPATAQPKCTELENVSFADAMSVCCESAELIGRTEIALMQKEFETLQTAQLATEAADVTLANEGFVDSIKKAWETIKSAVRKAVVYVWNAIKKAVAFVRGLFQKILEKFKGNKATIEGILRGDYKVYGRIKVAKVKVNVTFFSEVSNASKYVTTANVDAMSEQLAKLEKIAKEGHLTDVVELEGSQIVEALKDAKKQYDLLSPNLKVLEGVQKTVEELGKAVQKEIADGDANLSKMEKDDKAKEDMKKSIDGLKGKQSNLAKLSRVSSMASAYFASALSAINKSISSIVAKAKKAGDENKKGDRIEDRDR